jgi:hypothetical protein
MGSLRIAASEAKVVPSRVSKAFIVGNVKGQNNLTSSLSLKTFAFAFATLSQIKEMAGLPSIPVGDGAVDRR